MLLQSAEQGVVDQLHMRGTLMREEQPAEIEREAGGVWWRVCLGTAQPKHLRDMATVHMSSKLNHGYNLVRLSRV